MSQSPQRGVGASFMVPAGGGTIPGLTKSAEIKLSIDDWV